MSARLLIQLSSVKFHLVFNHIMQMLIDSPSAHHLKLKNILFIKTKDNYELI